MMPKKKQNGPGRPRADVIEDAAIFLSTSPRKTRRDNSPAPSKKAWEDQLYQAAIDAGATEAEARDATEDAINYLQLPGAGTKKRETAKSLAARKPEKYGPPLSKRKLSPRSVRLARARFKKLLREK